DGRAARSRGRGGAAFGGAAGVGRRWTLSETVGRFDHGLPSNAVPLVAPQWMAWRSRSRTRTHGGRSGTRTPAARNGCTPLPTVLLDQPVTFPERRRGESNAHGCYPQRFSGPWP